MSHVGWHHGGCVTFDIVLLALVAAFLGLRLYSVLGKRTGHEQKPIVGPSEDNVSNLIPAKVTTHNTVSTEIAVPGIVEQTAENGIRDIMNADRSFSLSQFGEGAKAAYDLILKAFWSGDRDELKALCDNDVYNDFEAAIDAREKSGQIVENRLVRIEAARVTDAEFDKPFARITVRFDADVAALTKDKDGNIIGGSLSDAVETHDIWTFERDISAQDRNWMLIATDVA